MLILIVRIAISLELLFSCFWDTAYFILGETANGWIILSSILLSISVFFLKTPKKKYAVHHTKQFKQYLLYILLALPRVCLGSYLLIRTISTYYLSALSKFINIALCILCICIYAAICLWFLISIIAVHTNKKLFFRSDLLQTGIYLQTWERIVLVRGVDSNDPFLFFNNFHEQLLIALTAWCFNASNYFYTRSKQNESVFSGILAYLFLFGSHIMCTTKSNGFIYLTPEDLTYLSTLRNESVEEILLKIRIHINVLEPTDAAPIEMHHQKNIDRQFIRLDSTMHYLLPQGTSVSSVSVGIRSFSMNGAVYLIPSPAVCECFNTLQIEHRFFEIDDQLLSPYTLNPKKHFANPALLVSLLNDSRLLQSYRTFSQGSKYWFEFLYTAMLVNNHSVSFRMLIDYCEMILRCVYLVESVRNETPLKKIVESTLPTQISSLSSSIRNIGCTHPLYTRFFVNTYPLHRSQAIKDYLNTLDIVIENFDQSISFQQLCSIFTYLRNKKEHLDFYNEHTKHIAWSSFASIALLLSDALHIQNFKIDLDLPNQSVHMGYDGHLFAMFRQHNDISVPLVRIHDDHPLYIKGAPKLGNSITYIDYFTGEHTEPSEIIFPLH